MRALRLAVVVFLSGCALTSKATPFDIREFTPDATGPARPSESLVTADGAELQSAHSLDREPAPPRGF